ncbi:insulinase family protein, partial [candidate division KSB1 bacterium]|nr:insulinase family protein [candidate division KSB1 bacterium]
LYHHPGSQSFKNAVRKSVLPNGLVVVSEYMPYVRSVSIGAYIRAGSVNESPGNNGIAHFLEHMLFKGTKNKTALEIAQSLESLGGTLNGATGKENSVYHAQVLDEFVPVAIDVLTDLLQNPRFEKYNIQKEKEVILAEISHSREDPEELIVDRFYSHLFPDHPLGYLIYGTPENVRGFRLNDLQEYMDNFYTPNQTIFAAAGNIQHEKFVDLVQNTYHRKNSGYEWKTAPLSPVHVGLEFEFLTSLQQAHICIGTRVFGTGDERKYALVLMDVLLGGGMSSRLFQNIREKYGFAYSVYSFTDFMQETGVFGAYMACAPEKVEKSVDLVMKEFKKIAKNSVTNEELQRAKSQVKGNMLLGLESSGRRMRKIGETEIYSRDHLSISQLVEKIERIQTSELVELAREFLDKSKLNITVISPQNI